MNIKFSNKKITGIISVVPKKCVKFQDEIHNYGFSPEKMLNLQKTIGFKERRIVEDNECTSDLCLYGLEYLFSKRLLNKEEVRALVFISQTPDHFMPPTSTILHGRLGLSRDTLCFDINQGCAGYLYGLLQAFLLLTSIENGKVLLLSGDTLSRRTCPRDRNIYPLIGDAAAITIIENVDDGSEIFMNFFADGTRSDWLIIPAGAFRVPSTEETRKVRILPDGNQRSQEDFYMNGAGIFTFTQTDVPGSIQDLFEFASMKIDDINCFLFHQPNRFILEKLAQRLAIPVEKMPKDLVEKFGNSSSACIPVIACLHLSKLLLSKKLKICMSGFGVGLTWANAIMDLGPFQICELIEK